MSGLWIRVTCNWFIIGLHCATRGHDWRPQRVSRCSEVTACARCGMYQGARRLTYQCRYYCPCRGAA